MNFFHNLIHVLLLLINLFQIHNKRDGGGRPFSQLFSSPLLVSSSWQPSWLHCLLFHHPLNPETWHHWGRDTDQKLIFARPQLISHRGYFCQVHITWELWPFFFFLSSLPFSPLTGGTIHWYSHYKYIVYNYCSVSPTYSKQAGPTGFDFGLMR